MSLIISAGAHHGYGHVGQQRTPSVYQVSADLVSGGAFIDRILTTAASVITTKL